MTSQTINFTATADQTDFILATPFNAIVSVKDNTVAKTYGTDWGIKNGNIVYFPTGRTAGHTIEVIITAPGFVDEYPAFGSNAQVVATVNDATQDAIDAAVVDLKAYIDASQAAIILALAP